MSYLKQFEYDVFVSYAHNDNDGDEPWVSRFVEDLRRELKQRLLSTDEPAIFFDTQSLRGDEHLRDLTEKVRKSAVFLPVVTPSYIVRKWTQAELSAFRENRDSSNRVFAIDGLPLDKESDYPPALRELIRSAFWHRKSDGAAAVPIDRRSDKELYVQKIAKLAESIRTRLLAIRGGPAPPVATILLAQVTPDLEAERDLVRTYLNQFNIEVLPHDNYPGGGPEFAAAVKADCARVSHFVQLIGPYAERRPADLPEGYAYHQYDAAKTAKITPLLWCRPDLDRNLIESHKDLRLFKAPELLAMGIEQFKAEVVRMVTEPRSISSQTPGKFVFVDSDKADIRLAKNLAAQIESRKRAAFLPAFEGPPEAILKDLYGTIIDCSALVVVFGEAQSTWVRAQIRLSNKLSPERLGAPLKVLAVYCHAPAEKEQLGVLSPDILWIDSQHGNSDAMIEQIVKALDS